MLEAPALMICPDDARPLRTDQVLERAQREFRLRIRLRAIARAVEREPGEALHGVVFGVGVVVFHPAIALEARHPFPILADADGRLTGTRPESVPRIRAAHHA